MKNNYKFQQVYDIQKQLLQPLHLYPKMHYLPRDAIGPVPECLRKHIATCEFQGGKFTRVTALCP